MNDADALLEDFVTDARDLLVHADEAAQLHADGNVASAKGVVVAAEALLGELTRKHRELKSRLGAG